MLLLTLAAVHVHHLQRLGQRADDHHDGNLPLGGSHDATLQLARVYLHLKPFRWGEGMRGVGGRMRWELIEL